MGTTIRVPHRLSLRVLQCQSLDTIGVGVLTGEVNRDGVEVALGQVQGLEIGHVQLVETTTLPGDLRATSALILNKQTPCQLRILVGATIQAMGETMAMAKSC